MGKITKNDYEKWSIPKNVANNFRMKQTNLSKTFSELTGKQKIIPMTKVLESISKKSIFFEFGEIRNLGKKGRRV